jgi:methyltransferase family protein
MSAVGQLPLDATPIGRQTASARSYFHALVDYDQTAAGLTAGDKEIPMLRRLVPALTVALMLVVSVVGAQSPTTEKKPLDVPYVPTHESLVEEMLSMARVTGNDVLYDLGSGDGRIVITAARKFGTRGIGYDLDPERISEARENARRAGVTDRVRFEQQDIFNAKIADATVVTMYLLPDVNMRLRPKLLSELKPGTRIVSHNYDLGDWQPVQRKEMDVSGINHTLYLWIVPQRASGK